MIDEEEQAALMLEAVVMVEADAGPIGMKPQAIQDRIMRAKQNMMSPADLVTAHADEPAIHSVGAVYRAYQQLMESQRLLDYEDLIFQTVRRLETDTAFQTSCRERFRHVFVDEYQDVNHGQYRIIRALVPPDAPERNLCVIGDPDQSIYGFRGSDPAYFRNFGADYPDAGRIVLNRNYRSTDSILSASFQVIRRDGAERSRTYSGIDGVKTVSMLESVERASRGGSDRPHHRRPGGGHGLPRAGHRQGSGRQPGACAELHGFCRSGADPLAN